MAVKKLLSYLDQNHIWYNLISHPQTYTASHTASMTHTKQREMAKSIVMKLDNGPVMIVLPSDFKVDFRKIKQITGAKNVELAREDEMDEMFPDCRTGAMPPFGNLYQMQVFADKELKDDEDIAFNAGNHRELMQMHLRDFNKLVHPKYFDLHRHYRVYI